MAQLVQQLVVADAHAWMTLRPASYGRPGERNHHRAFRGEIISVTEEEAARGQALGSLSDLDPESVNKAVDALQALNEPIPAGEAGDAVLATWKAEELAGYVTQHSGEAQRVYRIERDRKRGPRKTVLEALGVNLDEHPEGLPDDYAGIVDLTRE